MTDLQPGDHPDGYLSTACLHRRHAYCRALVTLEGAPKLPARCRWCYALCTCTCHAADPRATLPKGRAR